MKERPNNMNDVIDSRDVLEAIEELEGELPESAHDVLPGTAEELADIREELAALKKLAALADLHRAYIGQIERGEKNIGLKNLEKIAKALGVRAKDLL